MPWPALKHARYRLWAASLTLGVWAWYAASVGYGLIWDDPLWYAQGANKTLGQIVLALDTYQFYRPLAILLNRALTDQAGVVNAPLAHLIQIGAHTLNVLLTLVAVRQTGFSRLTAYLSATVLAFLPWAWQAVAWQAPQQPLTVMWVLWALVSAQRFVAGHGRRWLALSWLGYGMGLGFQESALPMVWLWVWLAMAHRHRLNPAWALGHVGLAVGYAWLWVNVPRLAGVTGAGWDGRALAYGLQGMVYPVGLLCGGLGCAPAESVWIYGAALAGLLAVLAATQGWAAVAWVGLWLGAGLGPVWVGLSWDYVRIGERVLYPMAPGVAVLWAAGLAALLTRTRWRGLGIAAVLGMALAVMAHLWPMRVLYERGTTLARHANQTLATADAPALFINYPDRLRLKALYPWGEWGLLLAPVVQNLSDYAQASLGRAAPSESRAFFAYQDDVRQAGPYHINLRGVDTPASDLATFARTHQIWLTSYGPDGTLNLRQVGGPARDTAAPLAVWPGIRLLAAEIASGQVSLTWQRTGALDTPITVFVHFWHTGEFVTSRDGDVWDGIVPLADLPIDVPIDDYRLWPADLPPGSYDVWLGLYHRWSGERVPLLHPSAPDQAVWLGRFTQP